MIFNYEQMNYMHSKTKLQETWLDPRELKKEIT
jgi:hypothetical protein